MRRALTIALALSLLPAVAAAQAAGPACQSELERADRVSAAALFSFIRAGGAAEKCVAVQNHIDATVLARDAHLRCLAAGPERDQIVAGLSATIVDFRQVQMQLGCRSSASLDTARNTNG
jgi:hypothetical protein